MFQLGRNLSGLVEQENIQVNKKEEKEKQKRTNLAGQKTNAFCPYSLSIDVFLPRSLFNKFNGKH